MLAWLASVVLTWRRRSDLDQAYRYLPLIHKHRERPAGRDDIARRNARCRRRTGALDRRLGGRGGPSRRNRASILRTVANTSGASIWAMGRRPMKGNIFFSRRRLTSQRVPGPRYGAVCQTFAGDGFNGISAATLGNATYA